MTDSPDHEPDTYFVDILAPMLTLASFILLIIAAWTHGDDAQRVAGTAAICGVSAAVLWLVRAVVRGVM